MKHATSKTPRFLTWIPLLICVVGILVVVISMRSLFSNGFFQVHDTTHAARLVEMQRSLQFGEFPVRWSRNFGFGYGMPLFNFYAPLVYYLGQLPLAAGFSAITSLKMLYLVNGILAFIGMYLLAQKMWGRWGGLVSAVVFSFSTYRAVDLFVRGALSEAFALVLLPFALYGVLLLIERKMSYHLHVERKAFAVSSALLFLSPLVLIETLSSGHNDVWMMVLAMGSLFFLTIGNPLFKKGKGTSVSWKTIFLRVIVSAVFLFLSVQVKRSTATLIPVWILLAGGYVLPVFGKLGWVKNMWIWAGQWWADLAAILLFLPLFTELSRQFNPWYLLWPLSVLPFVRSKIIKALLLGFSVTSLIRYIPVMYLGYYSIPLEGTQRLITWSAVPLVGVYFLLSFLYQMATKRKRS